MSPYRAYGVLRIWWALRALSRGVGPFARWGVRQAMWKQLARGMRKWGP